jgi:integrase
MTKLISQNIVSSIEASTTSQHDEERDPVQFWLKRLSPNAQKSYGRWFKIWFEWLKTKPGYENVTPKDLVERQINATGRERYVLLDLLQEYCNTLNLARRSIVQAYTSGRSFFAHNRAELPGDKTFEIHGKKPPAESRLTIDDVTRIINAANLRDRSLLLVKWQGMLDTEGVCYVNEKLSGDVVSEIKAGKDIIMLKIPGRKATKNEKKFYTFVGRDAIEALKKYFDEVRGWPASGEPIWISKLQKPLTPNMVGDNYRNLCRRVGLIPQEGQAKGDVSVRYGFGVHEFRDVARTLLHTHAKAQGFDTDAAEFFMGHTSSLDQMKYDKFYEDKAYMTRQYRLAEPHLNIISNPPSAAASTNEATVKAALATLKAVSGDRLPEEKWMEIEERLLARVYQVRKMTVTSAQIGSMLREMVAGAGIIGFGETEAPHRIHEKHARRGKKTKTARRTGRTAPNGGIPIESPFQTRIVGEQELVPLLDQGWEVIRELASGKIIVRRSNHLDE